MAHQDALYGRPGAALQSQFRVRMNRILAMAHWGEFFDLVGLKRPTKVALTRWLRASWANSLQKGYHKKACQKLCNFPCFPLSNLTSRKCRLDGKPEMPTLKCLATRKC